MKYRLELGSLTNLWDLWLSGNELTGEIPSQLASLIELEYLALGFVSNNPEGRSGGNRLTGEIPAWLGDLTSLTGLWLAHNDFTGAIPSELGNLTNLYYLQLQGNQLTGAIPSELGGLTNLTWLNLDNNQFSGDIPSELGNLAALEWVTLAGNELTGCIPETLRDVAGNDFDETGLPFCEEPPEPPPIVFGDLNWSSVQLQNRIAQYIVEIGYGYPTDVIFGATLPLFDGLRAGDVNILMEVWLPNQQEMWEEALSEGSVFSPGSSLGTDWQSAFVIPKYLQEQYPELDSVEDLKDPQYKALFATSETGGKARLVSCVIGWACEVVNAEQVEGYGLSDHVEILNPGDLASLNADLYAAYEQREPWLGYQWSTNEPALLLDLVRLEEPAYTDECWESTRACAYPDTTILIAVNSNLPGTAPDVVAMLRQWDFSVDAVYEPIARWQFDNPDANTEAAAIRWLNDNIDRWSQWVTADAAASIRAALEAGEIPDGWPEAPNITPSATTDDNAALVALYNATDGPNWTNNTNWMSDVPIGEWYGVETDEDGRVTELDLGDNNLAGFIPAEIANLSELRLLSLCCNDLSGEIPPELGNLSNLEMLWLWLNDLSGEIPPELGDLANLRWLDLEINDLSGEIPPELGNLSNLETLWLSWNDLSGEIPPELGGLTSLERLHLDRNELSGEIPPELLDIPGLRFMALFGNDFSGGVPEHADEKATLTTIYEATGGPGWEENFNWGSDTPVFTWVNVVIDNSGHVSALWLGWNQLTGEIPAELGDLTNLIRLYMDYNQLTGEIPKELANLTNLESLYLGGNQLSGCIPTELQDVMDNDFHSLGLSFCSGESPETLLTGQEYGDAGAYGEERRQSHR